jgi:hypothetical protein
MRPFSRELGSGKCSILGTEPWTVREARSFGRICGGLCGMRISVDDDERIVTIKPDRTHPMPPERWRPIAVPQTGFSWN